MWKGDFTMAKLDIIKEEIKFRWQVTKRVAHLIWSLTDLGDVDIW